MSARIVARLVPNPELNAAAAVAASTAVALVVGCCQLLLGLSRLGVLAVFLAPPLISGFTTASAFAIAASQLSALLGLTVPDYPEEEAGLVRTYAVC